MKTKRILYSLMAIMVTGSVCATEPVSPFVSVETPFRCSVKEFGDLDVATTIALKGSDFRLTQFDKIDSLPRYEVNGLSFDKKPVDLALQDLLKEAEISVYTEDGYYPPMNANSVYGELSDVVGELTEAAGLFYRYDASKKELYIFRKGRFELKLPKNRTVVLAVLDALRGAGIADTRPDWKANTIILSLNQVEKEMVEKLLKDIVDNQYLLVADTQVYTLEPKSVKANWQDVIQTYGPERVYAANNGLIGKVLSMGHQRPLGRFLTSLSAQYSLKPVSQGLAVVPNGWKMRFDVGACSDQDYDISVLLHTWVQNPDKVDTDITLVSEAGEISSFNILSALDNELVVLGIPDKKDPRQELLTTLKLRMIRLTKEK